MLPPYPWQLVFLNLPSNSTPRWWATKLTFNFTTQLRSHLYRVASGSHSCSTHNLSHNQSFSPPASCECMCMYVYYICIYVCMYFPLSFGFFETGSHYVVQGDPDWSNPPYFSLLSTALPGLSLYSHLHSAYFYPGTHDNGITTGLFCFYLSYVFS
jgi:hypothetical protein